MNDQEKISLADLRVIAIEVARKWGLDISSEMQDASTFRELIEEVCRVANEAGASEAMMDH